ncbi:MAG: hypothetical protein ACXVRK_10705 [Gaiellaceae bacterium]
MLSARSALRVAQISPGGATRAVAQRHHRIAFILALGAMAAAVAAGAGAARRAGGTTPGPWCGGQLWRLMTFSDVDRGRVRLDGVPTGIDSIADLRPPKIGIRRRTSFQLHSWRLNVVVDRYRIASNGEIVLVLYSIPAARYMNAYFPNPRCLSKRTRDRTAILAARRAFTDHCPHATAAWQLLGATATLAGIGFWNPSHATRGALPNAAELRPLTNFSIVSGCGVGSG